MHDMLAGAAGYFEHGSSGWQYFGDHRRNRFPVTLRCRGEALGFAHSVENKGLWPLAHSAATGSSGSFQVSIGFLAASVSSRRRRGA